MPSSDAIGLSILSGAHTTIVPKLMALLKERHMDDVLVVLGGIIPDAEVPAMKALGVAEVFQPGASLEGIIEFIRSKAGAGHGGAETREEGRIEGKDE